MVQRREMIRTTVVSQKNEYEPRASDAVWAVVFCVAQLGEIYGKSVHLQVEAKYTLKMYDGVPK